MTEAACKIVFTQRFKCAGMKWNLDRDHPILALRVIALSGLWSLTRGLMLKSQTTTLPRTPEEFRNHLNTSPSTVRWLTVTHAKRWHSHYNSSGSGALYQGRFKSAPIEQDEHLLAVCR